MTIVERVIIESLVCKEQTFEEIIEDTGLPGHVVSNVLPEMLIEQLVNYKKGKYILGNREKIQEASKNIKSEIKDVMVNLVDDYFAKKENQTTLKLQKICMNVSEERVFKSHLETLEKFIKQVKMNRKLDDLKKSVKNNTVVFWGHSEYGSVVDQALSAA
jgi:hypothetical protein